MVFRTEHYAARLLTPTQDVPALQALFEACADFSLLVDGEPPGPDKAQALFGDLPPGKLPDEKWVIGLYDSAGCLVGVMDVVGDYPAGGTWFIGLLLIHPARRGDGAGAQIVRGFEGWAAASGARSLGLGVVEANTAACRFWERMGFARIRISEPRPFGQKAHCVIYMQRELV